MNKPQAIPENAIVLSPTPYFWDTRDATVMRIASIIATDNARTYQHFVNRMNDWTVNDAQYKALGMAGPAQPTPPDYEVLVAVWINNNGGIMAVAVSMPGADPKLSALVPVSMPPLPADLTAYIWQVTVNQTKLAATGVRGVLDPKLYQYLPPTSPSTTVSQLSSPPAK